MRAAARAQPATCRSRCCRPACCSKSSPPDIVQAGATRSSSRSTAAARRPRRRCAACHAPSIDWPKASPRCASSSRTTRSARAACCSARTSATCRTSSRPRTQIGLNRISFMSADVSSTAFNRPDAVGGAARLRGRARRRRGRRVRRGRRRRDRSASPTDFESHFISESPDKLRRLPRYYAALNGTGRVPRDDLQRAVGLVGGRGRRHRATVLLPPAIGNIHEQPLDDDPELARGDRVPARPRRQDQSDLQGVRLHAVAGSKDTRLSVGARATTPSPPTTTPQVQGDDWMRQKLHAHYARVFRPGERVLDIGCGTGIDAAFSGAPRRLRGRHRHVSAR